MRKNRALMESGQAGCRLPETGRLMPDESIEREIETHVYGYAHQAKSEITRRLQELEREWDIDRFITIQGSAAAFMGTLFGLRVDRKWLLLPAIVLPFLFIPRLREKYPSYGFFRNRGIRTRREIEREKQALRILRGDFDDKTHPLNGTDRLELALRTLA